MSLDAFAHRFRLPATALMAPAAVVAAVFVWTDGPGTGVDAGAAGELGGAGDELALSLAVALAVFGAIAPLAVARRTGSRLVDVVVHVLAGATGAAAAGSGGVHVLTRAGGLVVAVVGFVLAAVGTLVRAEADGSDGVPPQRGPHPASYD